jgi:endonuclease/exonuclease/phosphatase (EEP) superfamily protein YafD
MAKRILNLTTGLRILVWLYLAFMFAVWLLLGFGGDRWWLATVMLFGPRWLYGLPLALLVPAAAIWRRRLLWLLAAGAIVVVGPIMGFCLPWARLVAPHEPTLRVLTCNVKGRCHDNAALNELIRTASPDVVALQGCWGDVRVAWPEGWHVCQQGEMLVASRYPLREMRELSQFAIAENETEPQPNWRLHVLGCLLAAPQGDVLFCTIHPDSPRHSIDPLLSRKTVLRPSESTQMAAEITRRWQDSEDLSRWLRQYGEPQIIAGDLNTPPDSAIYRRFWAGYHNAFSEAGLGFGYTEWPRVPLLRFGIGIDHILSSPNWRPCRAWVGPDVGSDHLPLIADLVWAPGGGEP